MRCPSVISLVEVKLEMLIWKHYLAEKVKKSWGVLVMEVDRERNHRMMKIL